MSPLSSLLQIAPFSLSVSAVKAGSLRESLLQAAFCARKGPHSAS